MKTTITAVLLCVLAALGILNVGQSIRNHLFPSHDEVEIDADVEYMVQSASQAAGDEVMIDERFKVREGDLLDLSLSHADVEIATTDKMEAHVRVSVSGSDMDKAREFFESRNFEVRQDGNRIIVKTNPKNRNWNWSSGHVDINVDISIPARFNADVSMSHGDLELDDLEGNLDVKSSHGDVEVASVDGEYVKVKHSHGDIEVGRASAKSVELLSSHGELEVKQIYAGKVDAASSHGDMSLGIKEAGTLDLTNSHGAVELIMSSAVGGSIRNSHGNIEIETVDNAAMTLDLQGSHVSIDKSMAFSGTNTSKRVEGTLNGGGPLLKARTSYGSIEIGS